MRGASERALLIGGHMGGRASTSWAFAHAKRGLIRDLT
jgi:hypothetical protein